MPQVTDLDQLQQALADDGELALAVAAIEATAQGETQRSPQFVRLVNRAISLAERLAKLTTLPPATGYNRVQRLETHP